MPGVPCHMDADDSISEKGPSGVVGKEGHGGCSGTSGGPGVTGYPGDPSHNYFLLHQRYSDALGEQSKTLSKYADALEDRNDYARFAFEVCRIFGFDVAVTRKREGRERVFTACLLRVDETLRNYELVLNKHHELEERCRKNGTVLRDVLGMEPNTTTDELTDKILATLEKSRKDERKAQVDPRVFNPKGPNDNGVCQVTSESSIDWHEYALNLERTLNQQAGMLREIDSAVFGDAHGMVPHAEVVARITEIKTQLMRKEEQSLRESEARMLVQDQRDRIKAMLDAARANTKALEESRIELAKKLEEAKSCETRVMQYIEEIAKDVAIVVCNLTDAGKAADVISAN
jgi:hypothetical protein